MKTLALILVLPLLAGCLVNRPYALKETPVLLYSTNGVPLIGMERIITKSTTLAAGDSKQAVASLAAKSTKTTQSAGAEGIQQEASTAGLQELFKAVLQMGIEMGKRSVMPPIPTP